MKGSSHILVVDDILANRKLAEKILKDKYRVTTVCSGEEALEAIQDDCPDLVLLDIHMDGIDGFETLENIRQNPEYESLPVIFLTSDIENKTEVRGFKAGAMDFIAKPFVPVVMLARVGRALELAHLRNVFKSDAEEMRLRWEQLAIQVIQLLVELMEQRGQVIPGHAQQVAEISCQIAQQIGDLSIKPENIYYMGLLHDLGKLFLPDRLQGKMGKVDEEDREHFAQALAASGSLLQMVAELPNIWEGSYYKENYDGTGIPDQLKGEEIPEGGRIVAGACVYAHLMDPEEGLVPSQVEEKLRAMSGKRLDPRVVEALLNLIEHEGEEF